MKSNKTFLLLLLCGFLFTSCKKDSTADANAASVDSNGNLQVDNEADGACYAVNTRTFLSTTGTDYYDISSSFAWFGKQQPVSLKDAGTVSANDNELTNLGGYNVYMYIGADDIFPSNAINWSIAGNSTSGIAAFDYTDNTAFPTGPNFTLPSSVNINNNFTISFTPVSNVTGIVFSVQGNIGRKNKAVKGGAGSVTFTSAEMKEVALEHDAIAFMVMPVLATPVTINGKKIYFVKQTQYQRETTTL